MKGSFISSPAKRGRGEGSQLVPQGWEVRKFADIIAQQQAIIFKIQNLRRPRDLLLPRLLSGQVIPAEVAT